MERRRAQFCASVKGNARGLLDRLRRVALDAEPALAAQIVERGARLAELDHAPREYEALLHELMGSLFGLTPEEPRLVEAGGGKGALRSGLAPARRGLDPDGMNVKAIVHEVEEGGYWAEVRALPGCASQGETMEELIAKLREAVAGGLTVYKKEGPMRE